ncbi:MAG: four helix bundle protein [Cyclobacteriaceae bacterium]|nr:four helix bundle protein [Cyclobacteriaceae bacterium]
MELGEDINILAEKFSGKEVFNLSSQIRRVVDSALNTCLLTRQVPKGFIGQSNPAYKKLSDKMILNFQLQTSSFRLRTSSFQLQTTY